MAFDGYHKWLGIPPSEQPPNHYRLLGIALFETDPDVIDASANRQMAYVQSCATGDNAALSQRILNELAAARICLLDTNKKVTYDAELRAKQATAVPVQAAATVLRAQVVPPQVGQAPQAKPAVQSPNRHDVRYQRRPTAGKWAQLMVVIGIALGGALGVYVGLWILNSSGSDGPNVSQWLSQLIRRDSADERVVDGSNVKSSSDAEGAAQPTSTARKPATGKVPSTPTTTILVPQRPAPSPTPLATPPSVHPKPSGTMSTLAAAPPVPEVKTHSDSLTLGNTPPLAVAPFDTATARKHQEAWAKYLGTTVETTNSVGAKLILIPPGEFLMGSSNEQIAAALKMLGEKIKQWEKDRIEKTERPQHRVVITKPFLIGATEITVGQFRKFVAASGYQTEAEKKAVKDGRGESYLNPRGGRELTEESPAPLITWNDATEYCTWLSRQENVMYRLPTEAEWEYACRAGTIAHYSFGDDVKSLKEFASYPDRYELVGKKLPNAFGVYDMHGSLVEWCGDYYDDSYYAKSSTIDPTGPPAGSNYVVRGSLRWSFENDCRSAFRSGYSPTYIYWRAGFRVVCVLESSLTASIGITPTPPVVAPSALAWDQKSAIDVVRRVGGKIDIRNDKVIGIDLRDSKATEETLLSLPFFTDLEALSLEYIRLSVNGLAPLRQLKGLRRLNLSGCGDAITDDGIKHIKELTNLESLDLERATITNAGMKHLKSLTKLKQLWLFGQFSDEGLESLQVMPDLEQLWLYCPNVTDAGLKHLHQIPKLRFLKIPKAKFTATGISELKKRFPEITINADF